MNIQTTEHKRLHEDKERTQYWKRWGPYISERQWGTVREDYSENGDAWDYLPHDHARSRAYRWGEDGIAGITDTHERLCFAFAFWNGKDPILKERMFGLSGPEGNHGEDVKEYYWYLDNTPTHSYMKYLYKYPQNEYPYEKLREENKKRSREEGEYELIDTGIFDEDRYYDLFIEYAKASPDDLCIRLTIENRGKDTQILHVLPTLWFRNTWSWREDGREKPHLNLHSEKDETLVVKANHPTLGNRYLVAEKPLDALFTENNTNAKRLFQSENETPYVKDAFHEFLIQKSKSAVNPSQEGTKAGLHYEVEVPGNGKATILLRLSEASEARLDEVPSIIEKRKQEADAFYQAIIPEKIPEKHRQVTRQAFSGMLWSKQYYRYVIERWLEGDAKQPPPPPERKKGRNADWTHFFSEDILSMPDKWEYPWFASWDSAFHCIPFAIIDPEYAKQQLLKLTREWYMHPNGQIPAYEWSFCDVNPPVHAWAAMRIYQMEKKRLGKGDEQFLERVFQKLLLNFTWWVNRKDTAGKNIFQGGFLGLDNISVFDRSVPIPDGGRLDQSDATSWMAMYCLNLLTISLELAQFNESYEDIASKFFEHFLYIANAMNEIGDEKTNLWDEKDGFFYDVIHFPDGTQFPLRVRSIVGLIPLLAVMTIDSELLDKLPGFKDRFEWFLKHRKDLCMQVNCQGEVGKQGRRLLSIVDEDKLTHILRWVLSEERFLSKQGVRSVSACHGPAPFVVNFKGKEYRVDYEPGESTSNLFGGNSNWRGPVWFPFNFLLIESLQKFNYYFGNDLRVECPTHSEHKKNLWEVGIELSKRLVKIFTGDEKAPPNSFS